MNATIEQVKEILTEARWRAKRLDWELQGVDPEAHPPEDLLEALWNTQETIALCKARLAQEAAK